MKKRKKKKKKNLNQGLEFRWCHLLESKTWWCIHDGHYSIHENMDLLKLPSEAWRDYLSIIHGFSEKELLLHWRSVDCFLGQYFISKFCYSWDPKMDRQEWSEVVRELYCFDKSSSFLSFFVLFLSNEEISQTHTHKIS